MDRALRGLIMADDDMIQATFDGRKCITIREGHRDYSPGPVLIADKDLTKAIMKKITNVRHTTIGELTQEELHDDGFTDWRSAVNCLSQWYPNITWRSEVTVIRWENV